MKSEELALKTYVSILRGINVSGQKKIQMADLKVLYEALGFKDIISYIQSGNVIFKTSEDIDPRTISRLIEDKIKEKYAFEVPVILRTTEEIQKVLNQNPFLNTNVELERIYVTFLEDKPLPEDLVKLTAIDYSPEKFIVKNMEIYLYCPTGYGTTKLSNTFFEKKLKLTASTRNWKTVIHLTELSLL